MTRRGRIQCRAAILEILPLGEVAAVLINAVLVGVAYPQKAVSLLDLVKKSHYGLGIGFGRFNKIFLDFIISLCKFTLDFSGLM